jgi:hypothetical protein
MIIHVPTVDLADPFHQTIVSMHLCFHQRQTQQPPQVFVAVYDGVGRGILEIILFYFISFHFCK